MTDATKVIATVDVESAWASKINWTQAVGGAAMVLTFVTGGKIGMTIDQQAAVVTTIGVVINVATWVLKTWFTKTITPASAAAPEVPTATVSTEPTPISLVAKASAIVAILILGSFLFPSPSFAQIKKPALTGNPIKDLQTDFANQGIPIPTVTPGSTGCDFNIFAMLVPSNVVTQIQNCVSDVNKQFLPDVQAALDSATSFKDQPGMACLGPALNIVKAAVGVPAVPAVAAVEAQPTAVPPVVAVAAVAAVPGQQPGVILIFQKFREFVLAGGPAACKTWATSTVSGATAGTL